MTELEWLWLATDKDLARPVLTTLHVTPEFIEATDGHRLHRIKPHNFAFQPGLIQANGKHLESVYPNSSQVVVPATAPHRQIKDVTSLQVAADMAFAATRDRSHLYFVSPDGETEVWLQGRYVKEALAISRGGAWTLRNVGPLLPVQFECLTYTAVVMPIKGVPPLPLHIDLEPFLGPWEQSLK